MQHGTGLHLNQWSNTSISKAQIQIFTTFTCSYQFEEPPSPLSMRSILFVPWYSYSIYWQHNKELSKQFNWERNYYKLHVGCNWLYKVKQSWLYKKTTVGVFLMGDTNIKIQVVEQIHVYCMHRAGYMTSQRKAKLWTYSMKSETERRHV